MFWPECEGISEPGDQIRRSPDVIYRLLNTALRTYLTRYGAIIVLELSVSNEFVVAWVDWPALAIACSFVQPIKHPVRELFDQPSTSDDKLLASMHLPNFRNLSSLERLVEQLKIGR